MNEKLPSLDEVIRDALREEGFVEVLKTRPMLDRAPEVADQLALWLKAKEIEALEKANAYETGLKSFYYFSGKAEAFSNAWAHIVFDGKDVNSGISPVVYNAVNEDWSEKAAEVEL